MWNNTIDFKRKFGGSFWCIGGDFNAVSNKKERKGNRSHCNQKEVDDFSEFIDCLELIDVPYINNFFSWSNIKGSARSRLDRFLISESWMNHWKVVVQEVGLKDISNHASIWIKNNYLNWGPKLFRVFRCWFEHPNFRSFVVESWNSSQWKGV